MSCGLVAETQDARRVEGDVRSELGLDATVGSDKQYYTKTKEWRTTVAIRVLGDAGDPLVIRPKIEAIVRRDFRVPVDTIVFK